MKLTRRRFLALLSAAAGGFILDAVVVEPRTLLWVNLVQLQLSGNLGFSLKIAHLSDSHFPSASHLVYGKAVEGVKGFNPDYVFFTGDLVSSKAGLKDAEEFLSSLAEAAPLYLVWGNWDHSILGTEIEEARKSIEKIGAKLLANEAHKLEQGIWLLGVDDPYLGYDDLGKAEARAGEGIRLLLAHSPQIIGEAAGRVSLVFAGHTHGGQVRLPFITPFVPLPPKYRKYIAGLYKVNSTYMYVNQGLGTSVLPIRFNCPPELTLYKLEL